MPDDRAEWHWPLRDRRREPAAADLLRISAEELHEIRDMATDVGECPGAWGSLVPPADRALRIARVVAPVTAVDVQNLTQRARGDELAERGNAWSPAEGEADA